MGGYLHLLTPSFVVVAIPCRRVFCSDEGEVVEEGGAQGFCCVVQDIGLPDIDGCVVSVLCQLVLMYGTPPLAGTQWCDSCGSGRRTRGRAECRLWP